MGFLLAFAPFVAFAVVDRLVGSVEGLWAGAAVSAALLIWDLTKTGIRPKILEIGTFVLFAGLAAYAVIGAPTWSIMDVRLRVDSGLFAIVLTTMLIRQPFTLQYAKEQVDRSLWETFGFIHTNYVISAAWAAAFAIMVAADLVLIYMSDVPPRFGIIATVVAIFAAVKFSGWYPERGIAASKRA